MASLNELVQRLETALSNKLEPDSEILRRFVHEVEVIGLNSGELLRSLKKFQIDNEDVFNNTIRGFTEEFDEFLEGLKNDQTDVYQWLLEIRQLKTDIEKTAELAFSITAYKGEWLNASGVSNTPASWSHNGYFWVQLVDIPNIASEEPTPTNTKYRKVIDVKDIGAALQQSLGDNAKLRPMDPTKNISVYSASNPDSDASVLPVGCTHVRVDGVVYKLSSAISGNITAVDKLNKTVTASTGTSSYLSLDEIEQAKANDITTRLSTKTNFTTFTPSNNWTKIATINGKSATGGDQIIFNLCGGSDFGVASSFQANVIVNEKNDVCSGHMVIFNTGKDNPKLHIIKRGSFWFEVWLERRNTFPYPVTLTLLSNPKNVETRLDLGTSQAGQPANIVAEITNTRRGTQISTTDDASVLQPTKGLIVYDENEGYLGGDGAEFGALGRGGVVPFIRKTESFTIEKKKGYLVVMTDGANKVVTVPNGLADDDWFVVSTLEWDRGLAGLTATVQFGTEVLTNGQDDFDGYVIDRPCVLYFLKSGGKWTLADGIGIDGSYNALEKRVDKLGAKAWANVSELASDVNSVRWTSPAYLKCNAGETKWKWLDENTIVIAGIIRVIASVGANQEHTVFTVFTLPDGVSCEASTQFLPWGPSVTDSTTYGIGIGGVINGVFTANINTTNRWVMINWVIPVKRS